MLSKSLITNALALENCWFLKHFFLRRSYRLRKLLVLKKPFLCQSYRPRKLLSF